MSAGDKLAAFCLTEPNYGSDAGSLQTRAKLENGHYVVNGSKTYITLGPHAHYYLVFVRTGPGKRTAGISALIIPRDTPGLSFGKKERKMGLGGSVTTEMIFKDVRVPKENLLLSEGEGVDHPFPARQSHEGLGGRFHGLGNRRRSLRGGPGICQKKDSI